MKAMNTRIQRIMLYVGVALLLFVILFPFYLVFVGSLQPHFDILRGATKLIPINFTLKNYVVLFRISGGSPFSIFLLNSLKVALGTGVLSTIIATIGAYGLSRFQFYGKEAFGKLLLLVYIFPTIIVVVPLYDIMAKLHLVDTHLGLILIHTALTAPFCTWLLRSFFDSIPSELEDAGLIDGCSKWRAFLSIVAPLSAPGLFTAGMYSVVASWGEFAFALTMIDSGSKKTVPLGLSAYMQTYGNIEWGKLLAGTALNVIPILLIFFPLIKYFIRGFMEGALK
jgi:multiple sugar transport system permease protein